ncbi:Hsp70 family protein [Kitasatospora sp. NPDC057692]|uniref:Hsp70 family protein n=1 Tax=Kitasatospora sp. NPDC057692 TaxID=3346215 RepID=UPI00368B15A6
MHGIDLGDSYARIAWPGPDGAPVVTGATDVPATVDVTGPDGPRPARTAGARSARAGLFTGTAERPAGAWPAGAWRPTDDPFADAPLPAGPRGGALGPEALTGVVLAALARRSRECGGGTPQEVALALPAGGGGEPALRRAAEQTGLRVGQVLPESVAAALHYGAVRDGARLSVLVYDQGATGSDLSLLAVDGDRTVRVLETVSQPLGGDHWDEAVARELLRRLGSPDGPVGPLLPAAERLRLALDEAPEAWQRVPWEGAEHEVSLDRETLRALVEPLRELGAGAVGTLLETVQDRGWDVPGTLLLAGGLSEAPGTAEWLEERLGLTVRSRTPGAAVASGLALTGDFGLLRVLTGPAATRPRPTDDDPDPRGRDTSSGGSGGRRAPNASRAGRRPGPGTTAPGPARPGERRPAEERPAEEEPWRDRPWADRPGPSERPPDAAEAEAVTNADTAAAPPHHGPEQAPPRTPEPPTAPAPPAADQALHPVPVPQLRATRRDDHLLLVWAWPPDSREARVRWSLDAPDPGGLPRTGDVRCGRRSYQHDGGLDLRVGRGAVTVTVAALTPHPADPLAEPSALILPARPPLVRYEAVVRRGLPGLRGRTARLTFVADTPCELPALQVVHGLGRICPAGAADGTVLRELPARRLEARIPFTVDLPLPATRGPSWLICLPLGPDDAATELRPASLHRLKVS